MRKRTDHKITLYVKELESLLSKIQEHKRNNPDLDSTVTIELDFDTDWNSLRLSDNAGNAYQHSGYVECDGLKFTE